MRICKANAAIGVSRAVYGAKTRGRCVSCSRNFKMAYPVRASASLVRSLSFDPVFSSRLAAYDFSVSGAHGIVFRSATGCFALMAKIARISFKIRSQKFNQPIWIVGFDVVYQ